MRRRAQHRCRRVGSGLFLLVSESPRYQWCISIGSDLEYEGSGKGTPSASDVGQDAIIVSYKKSGYASSHVSNGDNADVRHDQLSHFISPSICPSVECP